MSELTVTASSGNTVNLRAKPSTSASIIGRVPTKTKVQLVEKTSTDWYKVKYEELTGYMMAKFLKTDSKISQEDLRDVYNQLKETLVLIEKILK